MHCKDDENAKYLSDDDLLLVKVPRVPFLAAYCLTTLLMCWATADAYYKLTRELKWGKTNRSYNYMGNTSQSYL